MSSIVKKIKLNDADKKVISSNKDICTDSHGKGCNITSAVDPDRNLN